MSGRTRPYLRVTVLPRNLAIVAHRMHLEKAGIRTCRWAAGKAAASASAASEVTQRRGVNRTRPGASSVLAQHKSALQALPAAYLVHVVVVQHELVLPLEFSGVP